MRPIQELHEHLSVDLHARLIFSVDLYAVHILVHAQHHEDAATYADYRLHIGGC